MDRPVTTTSHRQRAHALTTEQLIADYQRAHPGRVAAQLATRVAVEPKTDTFAAARAREPRTVAVPKIVLRASTPLTAVAR